MRTFSKVSVRASGARTMFSMNLRGVPPEVFGEGACGSFRPAR
jgi:hypothetical protein